MKDLTAVNVMQYYRKMRRWNPRIYDEKGTCYKREKFVENVFLSHRVLLEFKILNLIYKVSEKFFRGGN